MSETTEYTAYDRAFSTARVYLQNSVYAPTDEIMAAARIIVRTYRPGMKVVENVKAARHAINDEISTDSPCGRLHVLKEIVEAIDAEKLRVAMPEVRFIPARDDDFDNSLEGVAVRIDDAWQVTPTAGGTPHWITDAQLAAVASVRLTPTA